MNWVNISSVTGGEAIGLGLLNAFFDNIGLEDKINEWYSKLEVKDFINRGLHDSDVGSVIVEQECLYSEFLNFLMSEKIAKYLWNLALSDGYKNVVQNAVKARMNYTIGWKMKKHLGWGAFVSAVGKLYKRTREVIDG
jgi:hypothetical protein